MAELLGLDTRGNFKDGPMQDVHWPSGLFGYFPCYSLGAMYAAQWFAAMRRATPDLDARISRGDFAPVFDWLREHIWQPASRWTTDELAHAGQRRAAEPGALQSAPARRGTCRPTPEAAWRPLASTRGNASGPAKPDPRRSLG